MRNPTFFILLLVVGVAVPPLVAVIDTLSTVKAQQAPAPNPRQQPGATVTMYAPDQHDLYDGHFVLSASRVYMIRQKRRRAVSPPDSASVGFRPSSPVKSICPSRP